MPLSKVRDRERKRLARLESSNVQPKEAPMYNPMIHKAGDTVRVWKGKSLVTTTIPTLDADGNAVPEV